MPTRQQLESALMNADKAGDFKAAKMLANALKVGYFGEVVTIPEGVPVTPDIKAAPQPGIETPGPTSLSAGISAVVEPAATIASGAIAEPIAGLAGIATLPFADVGQATENIEAVRKALTFIPPTKEGMASLQKIAEVMEPIAETVEKFEQASGDVGYEIGGPIGGAIGAAAPAAAMSALGLGPVRRAIGGTAKGIFQYQSPAKQEIARLLKDDPADIETAKFKIKEPGMGKEQLKDRTGLQKYLDIGGPKIKTDKVAVEAIKQGFDEGVIAPIKGASSHDKKILYKMAVVMEKGKRNALYGVENRPGDIVGDSLMKRVKVIYKANKSAGKRIDGVAKSLKGHKVNHIPAVDEFMADLGDMGISVTDDLNLNFMGSDIEGLAGPERVISQVFKRMRNTKPPDAYELHRMKKFIDENVTYGKNAEGLAGKAEIIVKKLRNNIDNILDANFKKYDDVNTAYFETIRALDYLQDVAGKKMDLTGPDSEKSVGTLLRGLMSNNKSRIRLLRSVKEIEKVSKKYGGKSKDNLMMQVLFADELDSMFGSAARTSFQGQIGQAVDRTAQAAVSPVAAGIGAASRAAEKLRGINQKKAFKTIKQLLKGNKK